MEQEEIKIPQIKVQEPLPNCPVPPPCPVVPKSKPGPVVLRIFLVFILALVLAFVILAASGLRIVRKESLLDIWLSSRKPIPPPTPTLILKPTPTPDPTADWKTLISDQFGFTLKYPNNWVYYKNGNNDVLNLPYVKNLSAQNETLATFNSCAIHFGFGGASGPNNDFQSQAVSVGSLNFTKKTWLINDKPVFTSYLYEEVSPAFKKFELLFAWISEKDFDVCQKEIDQILSTFKFVTVTPTSSPSAQTKGGLTQGTPVKIKSFSLTSPTKGPLVIKGTVESGWMSEGSFSVKLLDASRQEIASASAKETISGSWQSGKAVEFSVSLTFTTESTSGFLVFRNDNPSGLPENAKSFEIPVKFK